MMNRLAAVICIWVAVLPLTCMADGQSGVPQRPVSGQNYETEQPLPGEEVVTHSGKKMKVWSTTGPVPVSQAPQPFEPRQNANINDVGVIFDEPGSLNRRDDSFDVDRPGQGRIPRTAPRR